MMILNNGKFYKDNVEVPIEIGNIEQIALLKKLIEDIDELRDDLEYDHTPEEISMIHAKIADRQKIIDKLI